MSRAILDLAHQLTQTGEPFVLATVVWCERPTSAKPGAQAIIRADGQITGWVGGSCTQPVVIREAIRALHEGDAPYLLRLGSSNADMARENVRSFPMTCASGGALDIYMEPHLPPPHLLLIGDSPVLATLSQLARALDFAVTQIDHADLSQVPINERTCILIATHGQYDEDALEQALPGPAPYVGMIGSQRRAAACRDYLRSVGMEEQHLARLRAPAGLDIGAVTPAEIAASVLAELVQMQHRKPASSPGKTTPQEKAQPESAENAAPVVAETAIDPVCGMLVEIASSRHQSRYDGKDFYFCCPACKRLFERNPQEYLVSQKS